MQSDVEAVKSRLNLVDVVQKYVPSLKNAGRNYKALCPFHQESTPSFMVNPDLQIYKCFGCGKGGDVINFIQEMEGLSFREALQQAAEMSGYELQSNYQHNNPEQESLKERLYEANALAAKFWHYLLTQHKIGQPGRDYAAKRKIRREEIDKFSIGYAPKGNSLKKFLMKKGFGVEELVKFGLLVERKGETVDKFRDRFMLTIKNLKGQVVGFSGRIITPSDYAPKYLNTPETLVYNKSEVLMGLYQAKEAARKEKVLVLEEGNIDLLSSHRVGIENIAATGGTALTKQQISLIKRYADVVHFAFDTDAAGVKALLRGIQLAENAGLKHKVINLEKYQDPDELIHESPDTWKEKVQTAENSLEYLLRIFKDKQDLGTADGKSALVDEFVPVLSLLQDKVQQQHFAEELALLVGVDTDMIMEQIKNTNISYQHSSRSQKEEQKATKANQAQAPQEPVQNFNKHEIYFLSLLLEIDELAELEIEADIFTDKYCKEIYQKLLTTENKNYSKIADELSPEAKPVFQEILVSDLDLGDTDLEQEILRMHNLLYSNMLRREILKLRTLLKDDPENAANLQQLQQLTAELKDLGKA